MERVPKKRPPTDLHTLLDEATNAIKDFFYIEADLETHFSTHLYVRLYEAADILRGFFHADGNGLGDVDLETAQYKVSPGLHVPY